MDEQRKTNLAKLLVLKLIEHMTPEGRAMELRAFTDAGRMVGKSEAEIQEIKDLAADLLTAELERRGVTPPNNKREAILTIMAYVLVAKLAKGRTADELNVIHDAFDAEGREFGVTDAELSQINMIAMNIALGGGK
jgi:hypothetical protein